MLASRNEMLMANNDSKVKKEFKFFINKEKLTTINQFVTGLQMKQMAGIPVDYELYLNVPGNVDELISNEVTINLANPGVEHFYTKEPQAGITLIVNGKPHSFSESSISFEQVVRLAFPSDISSGEIGYTVTYSKGPEQNVSGAMAYGTNVFIKNHMQFYVTPTHKS